MKNKKVIYLLLIIVTVAGLLQTIMQLTELIIFKNLSIEEIIERKYDDENLQYIKSEDFYFIVYDYDNDIIHFKENGYRVFYSSGIFPKEGRGYSLSLNTECFSGNLNFYRDKSDYVLYIWEAFSEGEVIIYDNNGLQWGSASVYHNEFTTRYYFKVYDEINNDFEVYVLINDEEYLIADYDSLS